MLIYIYAAKVVKIFDIYKFVFCFLICGYQLFDSPYIYTRAREKRPLSKKSMGKMKVFSKIFGHVKKK